MPQSDGRRLPGNGHYHQGVGNGHPPSPMFTQDGYFCLDCNDFVTDIRPCIERNHLIPRIMELDDVPLEECEQGYSNDSTGLSSSSSWSSSGSTRENTGYTSYASGSHPESTGEIEPGKPHTSVAMIGTAPASAYGLSTSSGTDPQSMTSSEPPLQISEQRSIMLETFRTQCEREQRLPDQSEIHALSTLTKLSIESINAWFGSLQQTNASPSPAGPLPPSWQNDEQAVVLEQVARYAQDRHDRDCTNRQSRKASHTRRYKCTFGCGYSSDDWDTWQRHELTKYPQDFWHCVLCRQDSGLHETPFICYRKDKFTDHLETVHNVQDKSESDQIRQDSKVNFAAGFERQCPFTDGERKCGYVFSSWYDRVRHCREHFEKRRPKGPWFLPGGTPPDDSDDSNDDHGLGPGSRRLFSKPYTAPQTHTRDDKTREATESSRAPRAGSQNHRQKNCDYALQSNQPTEVPNQTRAGNMQGVNSLDDNDVSGSVGVIKPMILIDVFTQNLVRRRTDAKFLALNYASAIRQPAPDLSVHSLLFKEALRVTREMGYQYVWIDLICDRSIRDDDRSIVYEEAALIIVIASVDRSSGRIAHFTCDFRNVENVLSWTRKDALALNFDHVKNLGHGTYGIVDEVRLNVNQESFARKMCLTWRSRSAENGMRMPLQEIEMLQKLNHESIPKFVAAYLEGQSLNILTLPVAECDLKAFLAEPWRWKAKQPHLERWFGSLASALSHMHNLSCRHKDVKPANILIKGHEVFLTDFGTSYDFSSTDNSVSDGNGFMTPKYCAPEVASRQKRGRKADLFSLGCVFLEMLTVDLGSSLEDLEQHLGFKQDKPDRQDVYHCHIPRMQSWLKKLQLRVRPSDLHRRAVISVAANMLQYASNERPTADEVFATVSEHQGKVYGIESAFRDRVTTKIRSLTDRLRGFTQPHNSSEKMSLVHRTLDVPSQFQYQSLPDVNSYFRLVVLWPATCYDDGIRCDLMVTNFDVRMEYDAICYKWQASEQSHEIEINDCRMHVTTSVLAVLQRFRRHDGQPRVMWIDSLCINRHDRMEASAQAKRMALTYQSAAKVLVWFGSDASVPERRAQTEDTRVAQYSKLNDIVDATKYCHRLFSANRKAGPKPTLQGRSLLQKPPLKLNVISVAEAYRSKLLRLSSSQATTTTRSLLASDLPDNRPDFHTDLPDSTRCLELRDAAFSIMRFAILRSFSAATLGGKGAGLGSLSFGKPVQSTFRAAEPDARLNACQPCQQVYQLLPRQSQSRQCFAEELGIYSASDWSAQSSFEPMNSLWQSLRSIDTTNPYVLLLISTAVFLTWCSVVETSAGDSKSNPKSKEPCDDGGENLVTSLIAVLKSSRLCNGLKPGFVAAITAVGQGVARLVVVSEDCMDREKRNEVLTACRRNDVPVVMVPEGKVLPAWSKYSRAQETWKYMARACLVLTAWGSYAQSDREFLLREIGDRHDSFQSSSNNRYQFPLHVTREQIEFSRHL